MRTSTRVKKELVKELESLVSPLVGLLNLDQPLQLIHHITSLDFPLSLNLPVLNLVLWYVT